MIRTMFEMMVSRALDDGKPLPRWVQALSKRNEHADRFAKNASQLDAALRSSAAAHRQSMNKQPVSIDSVSVRPTSTQSEATATLTLPPQRQTSAPALAGKRSLSWATGVAAAALFAALTFYQLRPTPPEVHAGDFSQQLTVVPGEVLRVLTRAAETSQTRLPEISPLANLSLPELSAWDKIATSVQSPVRQEITAWQKSWQSLRDRLPNSIGESTQEL